MAKEAIFSDMILVRVAQHEGDMTVEDIEVQSIIFDGPPRWASLLEGVNCKSPDMRKFFSNLERLLEPEIRAALEEIPDNTDDLAIDLLARERRDDF